MQYQKSACMNVKCLMRTATDTHENQELMKGCAFVREGLFARDNQIGRQTVLRGRSKKSEEKKL